MSAPCAGAGKLTPSPPPAPCQPPGDAQLRHHVAAVGRGDGRVPAGAGGPQPRRVRSGLPGRRRARRLRGPGRHWCARNKPAGGVGEVRHASTVAQTLTPWPQAACAHHPFPWVPLHRPHLGLPHGPQRARAGGAREAAAHGGLLAKRLHGESRGRARPTYPCHALGRPSPIPRSATRLPPPPPPPPRPCAGGHRQRRPQRARVGPAQKGVRLLHPRAPLPGVGGAVAAGRGPLPAERVV